MYNTLPISIDDAEETVSSMDIFRSALGHISIVWSENGLDTHAVIVSKFGHIMRREIILFEEAHLIPTAEEFAMIYECYGYEAYETAFIKHILKWRKS